MKNSYTVMEHRKTFYALKYVDYEKNEASQIRIVPPAGYLQAWEEDYAQMRKTFIYGKSLSFEKLIARMEQLQERFRGSRGQTL